MPRVSALAKLPILRYVSDGRRIPKSARKVNRREKPVGSMLWTKGFLPLPGFALPCSLPRRERRGNDTPGVAASAIEQYEAPYTARQV